MRQSAFLAIFQRFCKSHGPRGPTWLETLAYRCDVKYPTRVESVIVEPANSATIMDARVAPRKMDEGPQQPCVGKTAGQNASAWQE